MNKYKFIIKFIANKEDNGKYKWNLLFPFAGVIIGCMTVALTLSIMEGMEYAIFTKLENISFPGRLGNITSTYSNELEDHLKNNNFLFQKGIEDQIILMQGSDFRLVTIHGIEKFQRFKNNVLGADIVEIGKHTNKVNLYIGRPLAIKLDLSLGDTVIVVHPGRLNIFTGLPNRRQMVVGGIFNLNILDYDQNHIFCHYNALDNFLSEKQKYLYLDTPLNVNQLKIIEKQFPEIDYQYWEEKYSSFISAMKLEKFIYSMIGFLIVAIASFTMMSMMSLSVMQKVPQIGILRANGMQSNDISYIFIFQAVATSVVSSFIAILLSLFIIQLDNQYNLIHILFPRGLFFDFPLILHNHHIVLITVVSLILLIISGLYPSIKAARLDPVKAISFKR